MWMWSSDVDGSSVWMRDGGRGAGAAYKVTGAAGAWKIKGNSRVKISANKDIDFGLHR